MDDLRLHAVVARVVAWHNSHPLARRITAAEVNSVGYMALPCTAPGLPPPAPPAPLESPAPQAPPPPVAQRPEPPPAEPVGIDPVIDPGIDPVIDQVSETDDPGAIVIDVDPEPKAVAVDDSPGAADPPPAGSSTPGPAPAPAAAPGSSLRARMAARDGGAASLTSTAHDQAPPAAMPAPGAPLTLVCSEDFMAPWPIEKVLDWVRTHGVVLQRDPTDGPVRQVPVDAALLPTGAGVSQLWVATATIEVGGQRHRLLLGGGELPAVLGRRVWSPPRLLGAVATPCALVALAVWWMWPAAPTLTITPMTSTAPAASATALSTVAEAAEPVAWVASAAGVAARVASSPEASASGGAVDAEPRRGGADPPRLPGLPGLLDEAAKAQARATVAALRAERQASTPARAEGVATAASPTGWPPATAVPAPSAAQPAPPPAVLYGLTTRPLRTRAEAEQLQSAFQALLAGTPGSALLVELLPAGEDWRVVCWPYEKRADAERARALLLARGLRVELVDF